MPEQNDKNIRVPVSGEEGKHSNHKIRTIIVSKEKGIKGLYCVDDKKIITYLFAKSKGWTMEKAKAWVSEHTKSLEKIEPLEVDQEPFILGVVATYKGDEGTTEKFDISQESGEFVLTKEIEEFTMGIKPKEKISEMSLLKIDKQKQIVYGVFLVPEKPDHDGDVISVDDIEKVAHEFLVEYRTIDEMHKNIIKAEIVESSIAWEDGLNYYGTELEKGTWFGAIKIHDTEVWDKVLSGEYKAFSVRISGVRTPIEDE